MSAAGAAMGPRFAGYAALFDRIDRGGDRIHRGAFVRSLAALPALPLLWQHRADAPIGLIERAAEDARGLRVIGRIDPGAAEAAAAIALLGRGGAAGLSFGYRVRRDAGRDPRELIDLDLVEVSLVTRPMMPGARVHLVAG